MNLPRWLELSLERLGLDRQIFGNSAFLWLLALAFWVLLFGTLRLTKTFVLRRARTRAESTTSSWPAVVEELASTVKSWFLLLLSAYLASQSIDFPVRAEANLTALAKLGLLIQTALWAAVVLRLFTERWMRTRIKSDPGSVMLMSVLGFVGKAILWTLVLLLVLENLGVQVTALVTGLGIGGVAVALAAQNILGDLFASLSIVVDRPFLLGDFIIVGSEMGTVEQIGLKTTRVRALSGEQIIFPNSDLLQSRIHNAARQSERRVVFAFSVALETPPEKLPLLSQALRTIIERREKVRFDRAHFQTLTEAGCKFEVVYFVASADYNLYMDIQQAINVELLQYLNAERIEFAKQTLLLQPVDSSVASGAASVIAKPQTPPAPTDRV